LDDVGSSSVLLVPDQLLVGLHNVRELVSQVILWSKGGREGMGKGGGMGRDGEGGRQEIAICSTAGCSMYTG
jgi:hypothetical protein